MLPRKNTIQERASTEDADEDSKGCPLFLQSMKTFSKNVLTLLIEGW